MNQSVKNADILTSVTFVYIKILYISKDIKREKELKYKHAKLKCKNCSLLSYIQRPLKDVMLIHG